MAVDSIMSNDSIERVIETGKHAVEQGIETGRRAAALGIETGRRVMTDGYDDAREYADRGLDYVSSVSSSVGDFVQRDPWIAVAGAFLIGYVAAQALRRLSSN